MNPDQMATCLLPATLKVVVTPGVGAVLHVLRAGVAVSAISSRGVTGLWRSDLKHHAIAGRIVDFGRAIVECRAIQRARLAEDQSADRDSATRAAAECIEFGDRPARLTSERRRQFIHHAALKIHRDATSGSIQCTFSVENQAAIGVAM